MLYFCQPKRSIPTLFLLAAIALFSRPAHSLAQFATDARWAPLHTNLLVLINSKRVFESEVAKKERAADASRAAFDAGLSIVSPNVDRLMIASNVDFEAMQTLWTSAVGSRESKKFDLTEIANKVGKPLDTIAGRSLVLMPSDAMLVELGPSTIGVMKPGNRQAVANWLKSGVSGGSNHLPSYLKDAVSFADANADVIIALDLEDALPPAEIRQRLSNFSSVPAADLDSVTETVKGIRGITLGITFRQSVTGSIKIDFLGSPQTLEKIGKPLLIDVLQKRGMMIDDIESWTVKTTASQLLLTGPLSLSGVRAIASMVSQPLLPEITADSEASNANTTYARSMTYFKSLESYVGELSKKRASVAGLKAYATWFENYAQKIDSFSILNVDPELVALGEGVSDSLRQMGEVARTSGLDAKSQKSEVQTEMINYGYDGYSSYGYGNRYANQYRQSKRKMIDTKSKVDAEEQARQILKSITEEMNAARKSMSLKYGVDF